MFSHRLNPRLQMTRLESNVLMNQIRAEKKGGINEKKTPMIITSHRQNQGKKMFRQYLYRPSLSPSQKQNKSHNYFGANKDKTIGQHHQAHQSRSGKKQILHISSNDDVRGLQVKCGRKRLDHSPSHQHNNTNINFCWN